MTTRPVSDDLENVVLQTLQNKQVPVQVLMNHVTYAQYLDEVCTARVPKEKLQVTGIRVEFKITNDYKIPVMPTSEVPLGGVWCQWRDLAPGEVIDHA